MKHEFKGDQITITYDDEVCLHSGNCVKSLPAVFDAARTPWVDPNGAPVGNAISVVKACPSGALQYELLE